MDFRLTMRSSFRDALPIVFWNLLYFIGYGAFVTGVDGEFCRQ